MKNPKKVVKNRVILNLIQDLRRLSLQLVNNLRGRFQIKFGMTPCVKGFTLIELLIVVLIIGILAAIAVPQYQKSVLKSRFSSLFPLGKTLNEGNEAYYLEHGNYTDNVGNLDVTTNDNNVQVTMGNEDQHQYVLLTRNDIRNNLRMYQKHSPNFAGETHCEALQDNALANWLCRDALKGTFVGNKYGYAVYSLDENTLGTLARTIYDQRSGTIDPGDSCMADGSKFSSSGCLGLKMSGGTCTANTSYSCGGVEFTNGATCIGNVHASCRSTFTDSSCISNGGDGTCGYTTFVNSTCEARKGCCSGCFRSSFISSICTGNAAGGCKSGNFENNSVCYSNVPGACAGATFDDTSYCAGSFCPNGAPSSDSTKVWYRGTGSGWPNTRASELVDKPADGE